MQVAARRAAVEGELQALAEQWHDAGTQRGEGAFDSRNLHGLTIEMFKLWFEDVQNFMCCSVTLSLTFRRMRRPDFRVIE